MDGVSPAPSGAATHEDVRGGGGSGACPGAIDSDLDGWHATASGGHDCNDRDEGVGGCFEDDSSGDCSGPMIESCNGVDDDCDGVVDDPFLLVKEGGASVVAVGRLLEGDQPALVVGEGGTGGADGSVALYQMDGTLVVRIVGVGKSASFGSQIATGRDLTGDGVDDLAVAAPYATMSDGPNSGVVFVLAGPIDERTTLDDAVGWFEGGELDGQPGGQLALAPDLTGDGLPELVIGYYRHTVLFSGAPGKGARLADAAAVIEMNTGGGSWQYTSAPDGDGDGRPELLLGMSTYAGGLGVVAEVLSQDPTRVATLKSNAAWPGLGAGLATVEGVVWALSGQTPVRLDTFEALSTSGTSLSNGGDLDGDGNDDLLVGNATRFSAPFLGVEGLPGFLQHDRSLAGASDADGDGHSDPRLLFDSDSAALLSGALAFSRCDADGDGVSGAGGDCDDGDETRAPRRLEGCNSVDDDCDGIADDQLQLPFIAPRDVGTLAVVLLGTTDAAVLGVDGQVDGTGGWEGTVVPGLSAIAWGGGAGGGTPTLLGRGPTADVLLSAGAFGAAEVVGTGLVADGVGLARSGEFGTVGDFDGDGLDELVVEAVDPVAHLAVLMFAGPVQGSHTLDDADWRFDLPDGWTEVAVGLLAAPGVADVTADGLGDVVLGSGTAYFGQGRLMVLAGKPTGVLEAEPNASLDAYGEPEEAMGSTVAVGGDLTGDGVADALVGGAYGARILAGADCPLLRPGWPAPSGSLAIVDLDADGVFEPLSAGEGSIWWQGEDWRDGTSIWAAGPYGVVVTGPEGTWRSAVTCD